MAGFGRGWGAGHRDMVSRLCVRSAGAMGVEWGLEGADGGGCLESAPKKWRDTERKFAMV